MGITYAYVFTYSKRMPSGTSSIGHLEKDLMKKCVCDIVGATVSVNDVFIQ